MGRSQAVKAMGFDPMTAGSNPAAPATIKNEKKNGGQTMEKIVKELDNLYGMGFAQLRQDTETGLYRGTCSNGNSTKRFVSMSECLRDLFRLGYK